MGAFPSGQRGQTVNLLSVTSVVRIHPLPPTKPSYGRFFVLEKGWIRKPDSAVWQSKQHPGGVLLRAWTYAVFALGNKRGVVFALAHPLPPAKPSYGRFFCFTKSPFVNKQMDFLIMLACRLISEANTAPLQVKRAISLCNQIHHKTVNLIGF